MKNQYFGDQHDYIKYAILRCIANSTKEKIGIHWLLTENDNRNDGNLTRYLKNENQSWARIDDELFQFLRKKQYIIEDIERRNVKYIEEENIIPNSVFFNQTIPKSTSEREEIIDQSLGKFKDCSFVFFDPDNGIEVKSIPLGRKNSPKYVYWKELKKFYENNQSLIIYQHFPRINHDHFISKKIHEFSEKFKDCHSLAIPNGNVVFFVILNNKHSEYFNPIPIGIKIILDAIAKLRKK